MDIEIFIFDVSVSEAQFRVARRIQNQPFFTGLKVPTDGNIGQSVKFPTTPFFPKFARYEQISPILGGAYNVFFSSSTRPCCFKLTIHERFDDTRVIG